MTRFEYVDYIFSCCRPRLAFELAKKAQRTDDKKMGILERIEVFFWFMTRSDEEWVMIREDLRNITKKIIIEGSNT